MVIWCMPLQANKWCHWHSYIQRGIIERAGFTKDENEKLKRFLGGKRPTMIIKLKKLHSRHNTPIILFAEPDMRDERVRRGLAAGADQAVEPAVQRDLRRQSGPVLDRRLLRLAQQRTVLQVRREHARGED